MDGQRKVPCGVENEGPTEIRTRIAGFKVQSANHYTIGPVAVSGPKHTYLSKSAIVLLLKNFVRSGIRTHAHIRGPEHSLR